MYNQHTRETEEMLIVAKKLNFLLKKVLPAPRPARYIVPTNDISLSRMRSILQFANAHINFNSRLL